MAELINTANIIIMSNDLNSLS